MTATAKRRCRGQPATPPASARVAVYTRQSVADDKEFGSIAAQREAIEAFVQSQRGEGWVALPEPYDDHGFSGATTDRPAFQRLLADIEAGKVDVVAVYKIDRLSRSLADFARLIQIFETSGVTFVSITQGFSTTSSNGKLFLNILMSFAEYERATIAERTRDKMLATRRKGMWTGGRPVLGYVARDKRLVVHEAEAATVRAIFQAYLERGSLLATVAELDRRGVRGKTGRALTKTALSSLLRNPLYAGKVRAGDVTVDGVHDAIVDQETWEAVQDQLRTHQRSGGSDARNKWGALLKGLVRCGRCGEAMTHHFTKKGDRLYHYYVCQRAQKRGAASCPDSRAPARELETVVVERVRGVGRDPSLLAATLEAARRDAEAHKPELGAESRRLARDKAHLADERARLVDAVARDGTAASTLLARVAELDERIANAEARGREVAAELAAIESSTVDEDALREALAAFAPVWDELLPREQARVLRLLIEEVVYDGRAQEVAITFRPTGIRGLAATSETTTE